FSFSWSRPPPRPTPFPSTTLFRSRQGHPRRPRLDRQQPDPIGIADHGPSGFGLPPVVDHRHPVLEDLLLQPFPHRRVQHLAGAEDRKSTRLNSSHVKISYAVFCLK